MDARDRAVVLLSGGYRDGAVMGVGGGDVIEEGARLDLAAWLEFGGMWEVAGVVGRVVEVLCQVERVLTGAEIEAVEGVVGLLRESE